TTVPSTFVDQLAEAPGDAESSVLLQAASTTEPVISSATCLDFFTFQRSRRDTRTNRVKVARELAGNRRRDDNADTDDHRGRQNRCGDVLVLANLLFEIEPNAGIKEFETQNRQANAHQTKHQR